MAKTPILTERTIMDLCTMMKHSNARSWCVVIDWRVGKFSHLN